MAWCMTQRLLSRKIIYVLDCRSLGLNGSIKLIIRNLFFYHRGKGVLVSVLKMMQDGFVLHRLG